MPSAQDHQQNELTNSLKEVIEADIHKRPLTWKFAEKCFTIGRFHNYRSDEVQKRLVERKHWIDKYWDDISSLIKHEVFNMEYSCDEDYEKQTVQEPIEGKQFSLF